MNCLDTSILCPQHFFMGLALLSVALSSASIRTSKVLTPSDEAHQIASV